MSLGAADAHGVRQPYRGCLSISSVICCQWPCRQEARRETRADKPSCALGRTQPVKPRGWCAWTTGGGRRHKARQDDFEARVGARCEVESRCAQLRARARPGHRAAALRRRRGICGRSPPVRAFHSTSTALPRHTPAPSHILRRTPGHRLFRTLAAPRESLASSLLDPACSTPSHLVPYAAATPAGSAPGRRLRRRFASAVAAKQAHLCWHGRPAPHW
jgi:hypothetical protein